MTLLWLAAAWCEYLEQHARKIYASEMNADVHAAHALAAKLDAGAVHDGEHVRDLYRRQWSGLTTADLVFGAVNVLRTCGWLRVITVQRGGAPAEIIRLHPDLRRIAND